MVAYEVTFAGKIVILLKTKLTIQNLRKNNKLTFTKVFICICYLWLLFAKNHFLRSTLLSFAGNLSLPFMIIIIIIYNFIFILSIHDISNQFPVLFGISMATDLVSTFHKCPTSCFPWDVYISPFYGVF